MLLHLLLGTLASGVHSGNWTNSSGNDTVMWKRVEESISLPKPNGSVELDRAPSLGVPAHDLADVEAELGLPPNATLNLITEDDESFQDQEQIHPRGHCLQEEIEVYSDHYCGQMFIKSMEKIGAKRWCSFEDVFESYDNLTFCMEQLSSALGCYYPNPAVQAFFLRTHTRFFQACRDREPLLSDAPQGLVVVLALVPVALIPFLVFLVVWRSSKRD